MTTPKQTPEQAAITAALNNILWAKWVRWLDYEKTHGWFFHSKKPTETEAHGVSEDDTCPMKLPRWPGDWRGSLHRVIHEDGKSRVEWVGGGR